MSDVALVNALDSRELDLTDKRIREVFGARVSGISMHGGTVYVHFVDTPTAQDETDALAALTLAVTKAAESDIVKPSIQEVATWR